MSRLRTAFALLFQLLLLQIGMLGGGMACAPEWLGLVAGAQPTANAGAEHAASSGHAGHVAAAHAAHAAHGAVRDAAGDRSSAEPVEAPAPERGGAPTHCAATTGCAAVAVDAPEVIAASFAVVHTSVQVGRVSLPHSTRQAPEPPPPRV